MPSAHQKRPVSLQNEMISIDTVDCCLILKFDTDRFDSTNASMFVDAIGKVSLDSVNSILLDFEMVKLIDSSAVGILLDYYKALPVGKRNISIRKPQPAVATMIEFLRLHHVFKIEP